jgi:hypothetical protein
MDKVGEEPCQLLPPVLQPDLTPDTGEYTAEMLSQLRVQASLQPTAHRNPVTAAMLQYCTPMAASAAQLQHQLHNLAPLTAASLTHLRPRLLRCLQATMAPSQTLLTSHQQPTSQLPHGAWSS